MTGRAVTVPRPAHASEWTVPGQAVRGKPAVGGAVRSGTMSAGRSPGLGLALARGSCDA